MSNTARLWLGRTGVLILALFIVAIVVGAIVMYLDLVQFAHDNKHLSDFHAAPHGD